MTVYNVLAGYGSLPGVPVEYLIVAGGGGGGGGGVTSFTGGGGGAGGVCEGTTKALFDVSLAVTVGSGGIPGTSSADGGQGNSSSFSGITAVGGGGGATSLGSKRDGLAGGSGGGGRYSTAIGGAATAFQGYAGGACLSNGGGAGGGGAGGLGGDAGLAGGDGGPGKISKITGKEIYYAGGGAGGGSTVDGKPGVAGLISRTYDPRSVNFVTETVYDEGAAGNTDNWDRKNTSIQDVSGLGRVVMHGYEPLTTYTFTKTNLPTHTQIRYQVYWHFLDSLDSEYSSLTINGRLVAGFRKQGYNYAGAADADITANYQRLAGRDPSAAEVATWRTSGLTNKALASEMGRVILSQDDGSADKQYFLSKFGPNPDVTPGGRVVYAAKSIATADWVPATYSYSPFGVAAGQSQEVMQNGYIVFDTGWVDDTSSTFTAAHQIGAEQVQADEAMYFSHVKLQTRATASPPVKTISTVNDWKFLHNGVVDWTMECWFKGLVSSPTSLNQPLFTNWNNLFPGIWFGVNDPNSITSVANFDATCSIELYIRRGSGDNYTIWNTQTNSWKIGVWNHVAATFNSATQTINIFINGKKQILGITRGPTWTNSSTISNRGILQLGGASNTPEDIQANKSIEECTGFVGNIFNWRIVKSVVYADDFTLPTSILPVVPHTILNIMGTADDVLVNSSSSDAALPGGAPPDVLANLGRPLSSDIPYSLSRGGGGGTGQDVGCIAHFTVNSTLTSIKDSVSNATLTAVNVTYDKIPGTNINAIRVGSAGSIGYVTEPNSTPLQLATVAGSAYTLEAWVYRTGAGSAGYWGGMIINKDAEYEIAVQGDGTVAIALDWGSGADSSLVGGGWMITPVKIPLNTPIHIAVVVNNTTMLIYKNGVLSFTRLGMDRQAQPTTVPVTIGNRPGNGQQFDGYIGEVRIWNSIRTVEQIAIDMQQMNSGPAGEANTGGGGSGRSSADSTTAGSGYAGGSGIVVLRYTTLFPGSAIVTGSPIYSVIPGYNVYTFTQSGSITFTSSKTARTLEYLVVAGGGGGGAYGGGGGGGGLLTSAEYVIVPGSPIAVTVGAGGMGATTYQSGLNGQNGANSTLSGPGMASVVALGGGGGGTRLGPGDGYRGVGGTPGGSGGGGSPGDTGVFAPGGAGFTGQGYAGGRGGIPQSWAAGGGGGAGGVGGNASGGGGYYGTAGDGGVGAASSISGSSVYYAGGGGGCTYIVASGYHSGAGGTGGGGVGAQGNNASDVQAGSGVVNTGGGGGGGAAPTTVPGGSGGAGIVILRFANSFDDPTYVTSAGVTVANSGGYKIYTFTTSGIITFGQATERSFDYLVVAGGGGGGGSGPSGGGAGAGGGAGGALTGTAKRAIGKVYNIAVGKGGDSGAAGNDGGVGGDSSFDTIVTKGGGGGAQGYSTSGGGKIGLTGGSGGGSTAGKATRYYGSFVGPGNISTSNSNNAYLTVAANSAFQFGTGNLTIEAWCKFNNSSPAGFPPSLPYEAIYTNYDQSLWTTNCVYFGKHLQNDGRVSFYINNHNYDPLSTYGSLPLLFDPNPAPVGDWVHYAVVRNGNNWTLYRNGTSVATNTFAGDVNGSRNVVYIGSHWGINAQISNFRIVKGTAVYTSNFTPGDSLTAITNTSLLTLQSSSIVDSSTNAFTITNSSSYPITTSSETIVISRTGGLSVTDQGKAGGAALVSYNSTDAVDHYLNNGSGGGGAQLPGGSIGADSGGNGGAGIQSTISSTAVTYAGGGGGGVSSNRYYGIFNGLGQYLSIPANDAFQFGVGDFTIECWFKTPYAGYYDFSGRIVGTYDYVGKDIGWTLAVNRSSTFGVMYGVGFNIEGFQLSSTPYLLPNTWYHLAVVKSSNTATIYVNGVSSATSACTINNITSNPLYIGSTVDRTRLNPAGSSLDLNGYISNLRIVKGTAVYNGNFTPAFSLTNITNTSLLTLQSDTFVDSSSNAFSITNNGAVTIGKYSNPGAGTISGGGGGSVSGVVYDRYYGVFNGTNWLSVRNNDSLKIGTNSATVEFWMYSTAMDGYRRIITSTAGGFSGGTFIIRYNNGTFIAGGYGGGGAADVATATLPSLNTWVHVAWVGVNGTSQTLYINGVSAATAGAYNITESIQLIGGRYSGGEKFAGRISNLRVVNGTAVYTSNFAPSDTLSSISNTVLLTLQSATFIDNSSNKLPVIINDGITYNLVTIASEQKIRNNTNGEAGAAGTGGGGGGGAGNSGTSIGTTSNSISAELLVVGGGGAGGFSVGGGGGAGGLLYYGAETPKTPNGPAISIISETVYTVTVGAGGTGGTSAYNQTDGGSSSFSTYVALGGGKGLGFAQTIPTNAAGSGGGAGGSNSLYNNGQLGTTGQGNNGGAGGKTGVYRPSGGGGGAGTAGNFGTTGANGAGVGGDGVRYSISSVSTTYAGGGGGGGDYGNLGSVGGLGGGGSGGAGGGAGLTSGAANTGGGGGGGGAIPSISGNGGTGIVIVRYPSTAPDAITTGSPEFIKSGDWKIYKFTASGTFSLPKLTVGGAGGPGGSGVVVIRHSALEDDAVTTGSPTYLRTADYKIYTFTNDGTIKF